MIRALVAAAAWIVGTICLAVGVGIILGAVVASVATGW